MAGASAAARMVTRGRYRTAFWAGTVGVTALAAALASSQWNGVSVTAIAVLAGLLANAGLLVYETVFVRAGQDVPLS